MRNKLNYSPEFLEDLYRIGEYIESRFCDPAAAERITNGIMDATDIPAEYPETGARVFLPGGIDSGYRFVIFEAYVAVYKIRPEGVYVARAVHAKQDYMRLIFPFLRHEGADDD